MGLLDLQDSGPGLFGGLIAPQNVPGLALAASLLSGKKGDDIGAKVSSYANAAMQQQAMERQNRANDLQQVQGVYNVLRQQEFMRKAQMGDAYVPNPLLGQLEKRIADLSGLSNMSGMLPQQGQQATQAPQTTPVPPNVASQYSSVVKPEFQAQGPMPQPQAAPTQAQKGGIGAPAGGLPMDWWLAQDPTGGKYMAALAKENGAISTRYGIFMPQRDASGRITSYAPAGGALPSNALPYGPPDAQGNPTIAPLNGQIGTAAQLAAATAGGSAFGKAPYARPETVQTKGAPTLMTLPQMIENATGGPMPTPFGAPAAPPAAAPQSAQIPPDVQAQRDQQRLAILQQERQRIIADPRSNPGDLAAINTEIAGIQQPQTKPAGLELQDQGSSAAQKELGQGIGKEAATVFTNGAASVQAKRQLAIMSDLANDFTPSKLQPLKAQFGQYLTAVGVPENTVNQFMGTNMGSIQALTSSAISMAGKLTRQSDAQPSQLQFLKTLESMPMADRTQQGFQKIMGYLNSMHDYNIEKMVALDQWLKDPANQGDPTGFEAAWAQKAKTLPLIWNAQAKPKVSSDPLVVIAPDGSAHRFPSAVAATAFRKAIGQ